MKPRRKTPEADLQISIVQWFEYAYPEHARWLHHSPNGGARPAKEYINKRGVKKRYCPEGAKLKRMGTKDGFPDLVLYVQSPPGSDYQNFKGLVFEVKDKGKEASEEQMLWLKHFSYQDYCCFLIDDFDFAVQMLENYMHPIKPRVK